MLRCALPKDRAAFDLAMPLLARALHDDTPEGVWRQISDGTAQLWLAFDGDRLAAACVTQSGVDTLHFWLCGGDGCDWRALGDGIAEAARGRFKRMTINGRPGWSRVLGFTRGDGVWERRLQ